MKKRRFLILLLLLTGIYGNGIFTLQAQDDETAGRCKVHDIVLKQGQAAVHYGLPVIDPFYEEARAEKFPQC